MCTAEVYLIFEFMAAAISQKHREVYTIGHMRGSVNGYKGLGNDLPRPKRWATRAYEEPFRCDLWARSRPRSAQFTLKVWDNWGPISALAQRIRSLHG